MTESPECQKNPFNIYWLIFRPQLWYNIIDYDIILDMWNLCHTLSTKERDRYER